MNNLYELLGVDKNASATEIRSAFLRLSKKYNPNGGTEPNAEKYEKIAEAYDVLRSKEKKTYYDRFNKKPDDKNQRNTSSGTMEFFEYESIESMDSDPYFSGFFNISTLFQNIFSVQHSESEEIIQYITQDVEVNYNINILNFFSLLQDNLINIRQGKLFFVLEVKYQIFGRCFNLCYIKKNISCSLCKKGFIYKTTSENIPLSVSWNEVLEMFQSSVKIRYTIKDRGNYTHIYSRSSRTSLYLNIQFENNLNNNIYLIDKNILVYSFPVSIKKINKVFMCSDPLCKKTLIKLNLEKYSNTKSKVINLFLSNYFKKRFRIEIPLRFCLKLVLE